MKIIYLATHLNIGGISSYLLTAGTAMMKRGCEISVLSSGGELEDKFRERNFKVFTLPIRAKSELNPKLWLALPRIIRLVKKEKFDLIHAHTRVTQILAAFVSRLTGVPYVTTAHGFYKPRLGRRLFGCWGKRVIAVSPLVAEELEKSHGVSKEKIRMIYNAIDVPDALKRLRGQNPEDLKRDLGIRPDTFVIGSISRLVRDKGHEYLVEAVKKLAKKEGNIFLLIVGDGRERNRLKSLLRRSGLGDKVRLMHPIPDISGVLSILDVFVHPATYREGFGLAMLEAMVAKVPVVATDIWAINSIIRHRVNGFLVKPKNAVEICDMIKFIHENPEVAGAIARNGFEMASQLYSVDRLASELETVHEEVLFEKPSSLRGGAKQ